MALALGMVLLLKAGRLGSAQGGLRAVLRMVLSEKALVRLMVIMMVAGLILTRSRMGNTAFFSSLLLTGSLAVVVSRPFRTKKMVLLLFSIVLVDVLLLGQWFGLEKVAERLRETSLETEHRDEVDVYAVPLVQDFWLTGAGAATFEHIFPAYGQDNSGVLYDHAHNDYLELLSELGVVGFLPMSLFVVLGFYQSVLSLKCISHSHVRAVGFGGCMAIISLCMHSTVDFNLQIPANAMLFLGVIATVLVVQFLGKNSDRATEQS